MVDVAPVKGTELKGNIRHGWFVTESHVKESEHDGIPCLYEAWVERRDELADIVASFQPGTPSARFLRETLARVCDGLAGSQLPPSTDSYS